jgi:hypothetical protein
MTERRLICAAVRLFGLYLGFDGARQAWLLFVRFLSFLPQDRYVHPMPQDVLYTIFEVVASYLIIRNTDRIVTFAFGPKSGSDDHSN